MDSFIKSTIYKVLNKNPYLSIKGYFDMNSDANMYKLIGHKLFLSCITNTYLTPNYTVIQEENVLGEKDDLFKLSELPDLNIFGDVPKENFSFDISSLKCSLAGYGYAIVIVDIDTLELTKIYYFISDILYPPKIISSTSDYVTFSFNDFLYVLDLKQEISDDFHLILRGLCDSYGKYLLTFPNDYYDVSTSLSVVDLEEMKEYILADILREHAIKEIAEWNTYLDLKENILHVEDRKSNSILEITLSEVADRCDEQNDLSKQGDDQDDYILPGCLSESIDYIDINDINTDDF